MKRCLLLILSAVLGVTVMVSKDRGSLYGQRASLFELLPVDSTDIVFLGNSITHYCEWHELLGMPNVKNRGISGDVVDGFFERLDPVVKGHPKKIFVMGGINDISHNLEADSVATLMASLLDHIIENSPTTEIYLQSALPINNDFNRYKNIIGKDDVVVAYNKLLEQLAAERGITFINLYPLFVNEEGKLDPLYTNDGLHLLGNAYIKWRDVILPYVNQ
ncbi:MAG: sialate O-acetylesterase [Muribaculaceae bacterium]|nr:sialate O-acetylesterase [Muribaculaceae bacterium]